MSDDDSEPDAGEDDSDTAARISFRDYPSSTVVVIAALSSGLAWLLYKWRAKKSAADDATPSDGTEEEGPAGQANPSSKKKA